MTELKKDNSLLSGKGENDDVDWITVNGAHIPIKDGESPKEAIKNHFELSKEKKDAVKHLAVTLKKIAESKYEVSKLTMKQLVNDIINFKPIKLKIGDKKITAVFDKLGAKKNVYTRGNSDAEGHSYKLENISKLPNYIETATFLKSSREEGKINLAHKDVKEWHYFINQIDTDKGTFDIIVNVRDKGSNQYIYEVSFNKNKKPKDT